MKKRILSGLLASLILASLLMVGIGSTSTDCPPNEYCVWSDMDDDGDIDIVDVVDLAGRYSTTGTPMNKTELLYDVNNTITELRDRIEYLETTLAYGPYQSGRLLPLPYGALHASGGSSPFYTVSTSCILLSLDLNTTEPSDQQAIFVLESETVTVAGEFKIWGNPSEIKQLFLAYSWTPSWSPHGYTQALYNSIPGSHPGTRQTFSFNLTVPNQEGVYYLYFCTESHYSMYDAIDQFIYPISVPNAVIVVGWLP